MVLPTHQSDPHPIGYVEVQRAWVGEKDPYEIELIVEEAHGSTILEHPGLKWYSQQIHTAVDGAGVLHHTVYLGFVPQRPLSPPLDPRNMNEAPTPRAGDPSAGDVGIPMGHKEGQFGRGT